MEAMKIKNLYDLTQTQAASLLEKAEYPWEVLSEIGAFIKELGETLPEEMCIRDRIQIRIRIQATGTRIPSAAGRIPGIRRSRRLWQY